MNLYDLTDEYQKLSHDLYDPETGEINQKALEQLNHLQGSIEDKCISIAKIFKNLEADRKAIEEEKKNMAKREEAYKKQITWLKEYLRSNMERTGIDKIFCPHFEIKLKKNPPAVDIYDKKNISLDYVRTKTEIDLGKIRDELMNGVVIEGARLVQKNRVEIK